MAMGKFTRNWLLMAAVGATVAGCGTVTPGKVDETVAQVQQYTQAVCRFVPTAATVLSIVEAFGVTGASSVGQIATEICAAVTSAKAARGARPKVRGVQVRGRFV